MISLALAVALAVQEPPPGFQVVELGPPWESVVVGDWTYIGATSSNDMAVFARQGRQANRIWTRFEYAPPRDGVGSSTSFVEVDCGEWKQRSLQTSNFELGNMDGKASVIASEGWTYAGPGTFAEALQEFACSE